MISQNRFLSLTAFLAFAALLIRGFVIFFSNHYNFAWEGLNLYGILTVADGHSLYANRETWPFHDYLYMPLHATVTGNILRLLEISSLRTQIRSVRGLNILLTLGFIFFYYKKLIQPEKLRAFSFAIVCLLAGFKITDYIFSARNDIPTLFLDTSALIAFFYWIRERKIKSLFLFTLFSALAFTCRQNSIPIAASGFLWLLFVQKKFRYFVTFALLWLTFVGTFTGLMIQWDFQRLWHQAFELYDFGFREMFWLNSSNVTVYVTHFLFLILGGLGIKEAYLTKRPELRFLLLALTLSVFPSSVQFFKMGGDYNYFFQAFIVGIFFATLAFERLFNDLKFQKKLTIACCIQFVLITVCYGLKTQSAVQNNAYPFEAMARTIREELKPYGYVYGKLDSNMILYLKGWSAHGVDVSSGSYIAILAKEKTIWILEDLQKKVESGVVPWAVEADPICEKRNLGDVFYHFDPEIQRIFSKFKLSKKLGSWLCVYEK